jgi:hypothetical protein
MIVRGRGTRAPWARKRQRLRADSGAEQAGGDEQFQQDLLARLPAGLLTAVPGVAVSVLFVATTQARAGRSSRELARMFGLSLRDAKTVLAYATHDGPARPSRP